MKNTTSTCCKASMFCASPWAARLILEKGYSQEQVADHLGVSLSAMRRWVRAERKLSATDLATTKPRLRLGEHEELMRLRKENEQLRMEREILKKAAVFR